MSRVFSAVAALAVLVALAAAFAGGWLLAADGPAASDPAAGAAEDVAVVGSFAVSAGEEGCSYDAARGGLVLEDVTVASEDDGRLEVTFYVERGSLDDVLPTSATLVVTFDDERREHTFDVVLPVSRAQHDAGYDDCRWHVGGS